VFEGPVTILFTDVVGSTDLRTRRGDTAAHRLLQEHETLVRTCVRDHGGHEVKSLGDGFMVAFVSARQALTCAQAIQRAVAARNRDVPAEEVHVRIGLNTGEVVQEGSDLCGQAVNAAARIAARANSDEILCAEVVKALVGSDPQFSFEDRGRSRLKGFPERWHLYALNWIPDTDAAGTVVDQQSAPLRIWLVGKVSVEASGVLLDERHLPGPQGRLAFAHLVLERHHPISRQQVAEVLWPDSLPASWDGALSAVVSKLRSALGRLGLNGSTTLEGAFGCYQLRLPPNTWVDVEAATQALHVAETAIRNGHPEGAWGWDDISRYIARRPFLPGEEGPWVDRIRADLRDVLVRALYCGSVSRLCSHDPDLAVKAAEEAVHLEPFREMGWQCLMRAHFANGNRAEALRAYERCRKLLAEELGISPSAATEAVYVEILRA
jgi:SARP family transcriptional regulator, regulator of embCAB operon